MSAIKIIGLQILARANNRLLDPVEKGKKHSDFICIFEDTRKQQTLHFKFCAQNSILQILTVSLRKVF